MHAAHGRTSACDFALAYGVYTCVHVRGARAYLSCVADDHIVVVQVLRSVSDTVGVKFALYPKFTVECGRRLNSNPTQLNSVQLQLK